jgi:hypothetical protein
MASAGMLRRVALVRTDVSEELSASIIRVTRTGELGTLAVTGNHVFLRSVFMVTAVKTSSGIPDMIVSTTPADTTSTYGVVSL